MAPGEVLVLDQDMTIARDEFLRCLPAAVDHAAFAVSGPEIRHGDGVRGWRIVLAPLPDLVLGMFRLPRLEVRVYLAGHDDAATRAFLHRFELYFRRGGG